MFSKAIVSSVFLFSLFLTTCGFALEVPDRFFVQQRYLSWTTTFDIDTDQLKLGTVSRRLLSLMVQYDFYDYKELLQATATQRFFSLGVIFDLTDATNHPIGSVQEKIFTFFPSFEIHSPSGEILAVATMNLWGTSFSIVDPVTSQEMATLYRSFFRLKDDWTVDIINRELFSKKGIDPRLFITVMAFQTDAEMWECAQRQWHSQQ